MKRPFLLVQYGVGLGLCLITAAELQADLHVWTIQETRHVLRSEPPGSSLAVQLSAARNEWESFQILVRADDPVSTIRLIPSDLHGPHGAVLGISEARLYRQHQLRLDRGTYRNASFKPDWYPDPLLPFADPLTGRALAGARLQAVPFDLPAEQTHGFWVDLHVPEGTPAGEYHGTYRVTSASEGPVEVPVTLTVWGFDLPRVSTFQTAFGSPAQQLRGYYAERAKAGKETEPADWAAVDRQCAQLLSEHRLDATPPAAMLTPVRQSDGSFRIASGQVDGLRAFVDRYRVNALETPHPSSIIKDPERERDVLHAWLAAFDRAAAELKRPGVIFYTYLRDEPNTLEDYRYVQKWGRAVREAKSVVKVLVVEQPWTASGQEGADSAWGDLYGAVDIWCPLFSLERPESAARREALGETIWTYTALCQGPPTPWWHIDFPLLNYRVPPWMAWHDGMRGLLYWGGMCYWRPVEDPWQQAPVYTGNGTYQQGDKGIIFNGEGSLVYPARPVGYEGVVPTIRLKALRDGIEDYDYLAILDRAGRRAEADRIVQPVTQSFFKWDENAAAWQRARAELAALILATTPPSAR
jgi:hypothetical protein